MKIITNWRYHILMVVGIIAVIGICSVPQSDSPTWWTDLLTSKVIGTIAAYTYYRMIKKWLADGSVPELEEITKEE